MGCCGNIKDLIPKFVEINNYLDMARYKAKQKGVTSSQGHQFVWSKCTQEELAYAYEELELTDFVEKTNTKNETKKTNKKESKKSTEEKE